MLAFQALGVMATGEVDEDACVDRLSPTERHRYGTIRNRERRQRWIGGRLVAKYLFLTRWAGDRPSVVGSLPPRVDRVEPAALERFPPHAYREIEILPRRRRDGGVPLVWRAGRPHSVHVSLASTRGLSGACLDGTRPVGLDVEVPLRRHHAFYRINFSPAERRWVEVLSEFGPIDVDRAYTLLWCLKESTMKSQQSDDLSLWQLPRITVQLRSDPGAVVEVLRSTSLHRPLLRSEVEVRTHERTWIAEAALATSPDAVITVLSTR